MTKLVLVSDTHVPQRAKRLPPDLWAAIDNADVVIHAGDWVDVSLVDEFERRSTRLIGVAGNNDGPDIGARLPLVAIEELDGVTFAVIHETGPAAGRELRCDELFDGVDVLVFGHSHIPWDTVSPAGMRLLNPGSPTDRRRQPHRTFMTAELVDGSLDLVELHNL